MSSVRICTYLLLLLLLPANGQAELRLSGSLTQGGVLRGQAVPGSQVFYGEQQLKLNEKGQFIIGFGRDAAEQQRLTLIAADGRVTSEQLQVSQRSYAIERIDGISKKLMVPSAAEQQRIAVEAELARQARQLDSDLPYFAEPFIRPVRGRISGVYGSQRILNGEPRRPHFGLDIAAPIGTPVVAPAGGSVTLAHAGMFYSGATLILDHGHGLSSSFLHLQQILVSAGESVRQGQQIATVGASGRVTGPHLDWRLNWFDQRLDPALLVPAEPEE